MKKFLCLIMLCCAFTVNANEVVFKKLDIFLSQSNYKDFFDEIAKIELNEHYIKYLKSKENEYRVPLYWLMANYFANKGDEKEMHKWLYIAIIMTQQDAALCSDKTAKYASQKILNFFPKILEIKNKTSYEISNGMNSSIFFIKNIRNRKSPAWVCSYGEENLSPSVPILIDRDLWEKEREKVFLRFTKDYPK